MIDDYIDFYCAVTSTLLTNPSLTHEWSQQWEYHTHIHMAIARWLRLASKLKGFSGNLLPGSREGHNPNLNNSIPLPQWVSILGLPQDNVKIYAIGTELPVDDDDEPLPHELDVNTDLVIQLMEHINTTASLDDIST